MNLEELLRKLEENNLVGEEKEMLEAMRYFSGEARKITMELNSSYHTDEEIRTLFSKLIGKEVDKGFSIFPPFYTDFGKNISIGTNVFINSDCKFQDQGGIIIGNNVFIGHSVVIATLNHRENPEFRMQMYSKKVVIEDGVWIGSNATITPGVTIGANAIIGAGSVVTKDVGKGDVVAGVPAKFIRKIRKD